MIKRLGIKEEALSLPSYELLLKLYKMLGEDSDLLFEAIELYNPYASSVRDRLKDICIGLWEELHEKEGLFRYGR